MNGGPLVRGYWSKLLARGYWRGGGIGVETSACPGAVALTDVLSTVATDQYLVSAATGSYTTGATVTGHTSAVATTESIGGVEILCTP